MCLYQLLAQGSDLHLQVAQQGLVPHNFVDPRLHGDSLGRIRKAQGSLSVVNGT